MEQNNAAKKGLSIESVWSVRCRAGRWFRCFSAEAAVAVATLVAIPSVSFGQNASTLSPFDYERLKLDSEFARFDREKAELLRRKEVEALQLNAYANDLGAAVQEYRTHIADQHQRYTSCKQCRKLAKRIGDFSRKIERASR